MAWGRGGTAVLLSLLVLGPGAAGTLEAPQPAEPGTVPDLHEAMAWSSANPDSLLSGWILTAAMAGNTDDAMAAFEEGKAWADQRMALADRAVLYENLVALGVPASELAGLDAVPEKAVAPITAVTSAQLEPIDVGLEMLDPWLGTQQMVARHAWLLGVMEQALAALSAVPLDAWPEEPVLVDSVGLVIIGGSGDDHYPMASETLRVTGPLLVIEPGGDDTYDPHIATSAQFRLDTPLGTSRVTQPLPAIALELGGNDTYTKRAASAALPTSPVLLIDTRGDDHYSTTEIGFTTASATASTAHLLDPQGNDTYQAKDRGLAYTHGLLDPLIGYPGGASLLEDREGADTYEADTGDDKPWTIDGKGETHASAENTASIAILKDDRGNDDYTANIIAYAASEDDAHTLFYDQEGNDTHYIDRHGVSYGFRAHSEGGLQGPTNTAIAYYLDANGTDTYEADGIASYALSVGDRHTRFEGSPDHRYSLFVDCTTPPTAHMPCPNEQQALAAFLLTDRIPEPGRN